MKLINTREFVEAFSTRNVVFESYAGFDRNNRLILRTVMEFGDFGRIKRTRTIECTGKSVHGIHTEMSDYQSEVIDIINVLEDYAAWVRSGSNDVFSEFIGTDDLPLYFHGHRAKGFPTLAIFGQDLKNLELKGRDDHEKQGEAHAYLDRINALADCYRKHLKALDEIPATSFQGAFVAKKVMVGNIPDIVKRMEMHKGFVSRPI